MFVRAYQANVLIQNFSIPKNALTNGSADTVEHRRLQRRRTSRLVRRRFPAADGDVGAGVQLCNVGGEAGYSGAARLGELDRRGKLQDGEVVRVIFGRVVQWVLEDGLGADFITTFFFLTYKLGMFKTLDVAVLISAIHLY
jgi:hypothetical protein